MKRYINVLVGMFTLIVVASGPAAQAAPNSMTQAAPVEQVPVGRRGRGHDLHRHIHQLYRARFDYRGHRLGQCQPGRGYHSIGAWSTD